MDRREFLKTGGATALGLAMNAHTAAFGATGARAKLAAKTTGIQIGAPSFVDEGIEKCLDTITELASVNTLFAMVYSYKEGLSGRTWPPVDHGLQQRGPKFHGGYYGTIHPEYYRNTIFKDDPRVLRSPDHGDFDLLGSVLPAARKRGIKTIAWLADQVHEEIPQFKEMAEVDLHGRKLSQVCLNHPDFRAFQMAMVEDCVQSYEIDGLLWRSERWGALTNMLRWNGDRDRAKVPCFCSFCSEKGKKQGIDSERVRKGYVLLEDFVAGIRAGSKPTDGAYTTFWRILLRYPEILAWEMFWYDSLREIYKIVYDSAKSLKPDLPVGSAIPHSISFNPFYRAAVDFQELAKYNDFLKVIVYHSDGGSRCCNYVDEFFDTYLADLSRDERLAFLYNVMGFSEGSYEKIKTQGLSSDYVYRETKAWLKSAEGTHLQVWPGIDIDVSPEEGKDPPRSREGVRDAVLAAFRAGAPGVVFARMYSEMTLDHLAGAGDAMRMLELN